VARLSSDDKDDLYYVSNDAAVDGDKKVVTLVTNSDGIALSETSLTVDGQIVYAESSDSYTEIFRQELKEGSKRIKIAEGKLRGFSLDTKGVLYFYDGDSESGSTYVLKGDVAGDRKMVSDRYYIYSTNQITLPKTQFAADVSGVAFVDADRRDCVSNNYPIINAGETQTLSLRRSSTYGTSSDDYEWFCVKVDGVAEVSFESATRNDGQYDYGKWVNLRCFDSESTYGESDEQNLNTSYSYYARPTLRLPGKGVYSCRAYDDNGYSSVWNGFSYGPPTMGMSATVAVNLYTESAGD